jgi:hypothetical protein
MDENPYLSQGSRETIAAAAQLANAFKGHLVVVSLDRPAWTFNGSVRADTITFYMKGPISAKCRNILHKDLPPSTRLGYLERRIRSLFN